MVVVAGSFAAAEVAGWSLAYAVAAAVLGMGASGVRLGAEVALIGWLGRDRAAVAAALGETTMLGGRAVGAPVVGVLGDTRGGAYAFVAIGLAGLSLATLLAAHRAYLGRLLPRDKARLVLRLAWFNRPAPAPAPVPVSVDP
jgi:hypothetical protein